MRAIAGYLLKIVEMSLRVNEHEQRFDRFNIAMSQEFTRAASYAAMGAGKVLRRQAITVAV
jgi:hypothetical protein